MQQEEQEEKEIDCSENKVSNEYLDSMNVREEKYRRVMND